MQDSHSDQVGRQALRSSAPNPTCEGDWELEQNADARFKDAQGDDDHGGSSVEIADLDQDGLGDLLVGAQLGYEGYGSAYVVMNKT